MKAETLQSAIITVALLLAVDIAIWYFNSDHRRVKPQLHIPDDCPNCILKRKES